MMNPDQLKRSLRLPSTITKHQQDLLIEFLAGSSVFDFYCHGRRLVLHYEVTEFCWAEMSAALNEVGIYSQLSWFTRLQHRWYCYVDENARSNALSTSSHCCNKPPPIPKKR